VIGRRLLAIGPSLAVAIGITVALAQTPPSGESQPSEAGASPVYKPPLRGAPGGRVGGASRSAVRVSAPLPEIELLAPSDHAG
jgi:hypothetical protein